MPINWVAIAAKVATAALLAAATALAEALTRKG